MLKKPWELKVYKNKDGTYNAAVGKLTESFDHTLDAINWLIGNSPNGKNAEEYSGYVVSDERSREAVKSLANMKCNCDFNINRNWEPIK